MEKKNLLLGFIGLIFIGSLLYAFISPKKVASPTETDTNAVPSSQAGRGNEALQSATVYNPQEPTMHVRLRDGRADFGTASEAAGFVSLGDISVRIGSTEMTTIAANYGGSGVFVYLSAFEATPEGYRMSDAVLLGDRIKVERITASDEQVRVLYYDYGPDQSMADDPDVRTEATFHYRGGKLQLAE